MPIRLSENFRALFYAPFYAAHVIGAYATEGVEVELISSPHPERTARALRRGEIDVMWGGPLRVMLTHAQDPNADSTCFCDVIVRDPFFIVGHEARADFQLADLVGKRFASVSEVPTPWLCLQDDLRCAGIDPASLNRVTGPTMVENATALRSRALDAVQLFQPHADELVASGAGHIWYAAANRGLTAYTTLVTRRELLQSQRDELLRMTRAMGRVLRWIADTPGNDIALALSEYFPTLPHEIFAIAMDRYRALGLFAAEPIMPREGFDRLQAAMRSGGVLDRSIPFEACVDNSLALTAAGRHLPQSSGQ